MLRMFAPEGYGLMAASLVLAFLMALVGAYLGGFWRVVLWLLGALLVAFVFFFFRDPDRAPPEGSEWLVLAPADGKVIAVEQVEEPLYLKGPATQISIFLSPLDVHVNRIPVDGVVEYVEYVPGDYLVAWHPKSSEKNERSIIGVHHPSCTRVLFKQIAGAVARRVVFHVKEGDRVKAGQRFGIVKFGSRMDVLVPPHVEVVATVGMRTRAGETVLARIPVPETMATEAHQQAP